MLDVAIEECVAIEDSEPGVASAVASGATTLAVPFHIPLPVSPAYALLDAGLEGVGLERLVQLHTVRRTAETAR
jgi:beta-phosphoglucomutase-like phosphatase (HAD superfamily)